MTGIEIVVGGTCHNQCRADGRPLAAYRILCSQLKIGKPINMRRHAVAITKQQYRFYPSQPYGQSLTPSDQRAHPQTPIADKTGESWSQ